MLRFGTVITVLAAGAAAADGLVPFKYEALPLGHIKAGGWFQDQLQLESDGLAGHEYDFYRFAGMFTTWTGGTFEYSELHESSPYWFNYIVPLAFGLNDTRLITQAKNYLDYVLDHQQSDGWLGPETTEQTRGIWARSLLLMGLTQYAEADPSETSRIVSSLYNFTSLVNTMLKNNFTGLIPKPGDDFDNGGFGERRVHELPMSLQWLYDNHPNGNEDLLIETMELMFNSTQITGFDWTHFFVDGVFPKLGTPYITDYTFAHGVNLAEGLRYPAILYRINHNESLVQQSLDAVNMTMTYHGSTSGTIIADEYLGGLNPQRGSETCISAEATFSLHWLNRMFGANYYADRAELVAFNALPGAVSTDWWAHQYVQQENQPFAKNLSADPFSDVNSYGNTFGLEPNYPCCTVNHGQTYPKFLAASYIRNGENGLIHSLLSPTTVTTTLPSGNEVQVTADTLYPFGETIEYSVSASKALDFYIRIPGWNDISKSSISVNGAASQALSPNADSLQPVSLPSGSSTVSLTFSMPLEVTIRNTTSNTVMIHRGPLNYALDLAFNTTTLPAHEFTSPFSPLPANETASETHDHFYLPTNNTEWAVAIDPATITVVDNSKNITQLPNPIFESGAPPVKLLAKGCTIVWGEDTGTASVPPANAACVNGTERMVTLSPYGAAKLRMAELPTVKLS